MSTLFFQKNLPQWERTLRTVLGLAVLIGAFLVPMEPWLKWLLVASGASFVAMGFVGFCPMCAMAGRRPRT
ncbi:hypothetical protein AWB68_00975 [Caballeronia choica]|jgi:hypothetical protein|uniref:Inner membrane protein YgaP-like transmembrane domain-containing protein n=1 Tax=Caballeronia choica TaxID=326476 RepID=A0A158FUG9_9BURK|nr:DUF2892 domain-containing protein [Caballeronia choica]SAL23506.1 hypothetical protein AWB68_00975 [Caballeronia choica]